MTFSAPAEIIVPYCDAQREDGDHNGFVPFCRQLLRNRHPGMVASIDGFIDEISGSVVSLIILRTPVIAWNLDSQHCSTRCLALIMVEKPMADVYMIDDIPYAHRMYRSLRPSSRKQPDRASTDRYRKGP